MNSLSSLSLSLSLSQCARAGARCDYGLFVGAAETNTSSLSRLAPQALALKMYLNTTFSTLQLASMETWMKVCSPSPSPSPSLSLSLSLSSTLRSGQPVTLCVCMQRRRLWQLSSCWPTSSRDQSTSAMWLAGRRWALTVQGSRCLSLPPPQIAVIKAAKERGLPVTCEVSHFSPSLSPLPHPLPPPKGVPSPSLPLQR